MSYSTLKISNGSVLVVGIRKNGFGNPQIAYCRPNSDVEFDISDGNYTLHFLTTNGAATGATTNFAVGEVGINWIQVFANNTLAQQNTRLANSYTLVGYTLPSYVRDNDSFAFFAGFTLACTIRIFRAARRWFARVGEDTNT